jgi:putative membrane protein
VQRGGFWAAGLVGVAAGVGLAAEAVGVATGVPFGSYAYGDDLGPKVLDVPVLVPMAWTMFAYPALLVGRTARRSMPVVAWPIGALALASWDVFLDPQMVAEGTGAGRTRRPRCPACRVSR